MRIGYFADGPWSHRAIEMIVADGRFEIAFIVPRFDTRDPVLADWAKKLGVDFLPIQNVNAPESVRQLQAYGADLFVSMSFNQILRRPIIDAAPKGFINCHAGALPYYRGRNILNWALVNDAPEFGVTVHYVDEGIDTGDIILQKTAAVSDDDNYGTLLRRAIALCGEVLLEAMVMIAESRVKPINQQGVHPVGFYCGRRAEGDEWIDWSWSSRRVFNFVRAISPPGPGARAVCAGLDVNITKAVIIPNSPEYIGTPGDVVGVRQDGIVVKTGDTTILLTEFSGGPARFRIGMRFESRTDHLIKTLENRIAALEKALSARAD